MAEYIERGILLKRIEYHLATDRKTIGKKQFADGFYLGLSEAEIMVAQAPAVEVEPVRHGHWIDSEDEYGSYSRCSECGDEFTNWEGDCAHTDRCPNCGAHMDEVTDNDNSLQAE